jgi:ADP-ribosylation factor-like protein 2
MSSHCRKAAINANHIQGLQLNAIKTHKWHIIRCSAITGANLQEGLAWVVQDAKARLFLY